MKLNQLEEVERRKRYKQQRFPGAVSDAGLVRRMTDEQRKDAFDRMREYVDKQPDQKPIERNNSK